VDVDVAEQPVGAGRGVRAQPRIDVDGEHDPPIGGPGQRERGQRSAQPLRFHRALAKSVVHRAVPTTVFGHHRQIDQQADRPGGVISPGSGRSCTGSLTARADPLFELTDAILCADGPGVFRLHGLSVRHTDHRGHRFRLRAL
jgi:hypothetical protein